MNTRRWIILALLLVALGGGALWFWQTQIADTPEYSLKQAVEAVEEHDLQTFKKYVDLEGVAERLVDDIISQATAETSASRDIGQLGESLGEGLAQLMKPRLVDRVVGTVERYVETGEMPTGQGGRREIHPDTLKKNFQGIENTELDGSTAIVSIRMEDMRADTSSVIRLRMRQMDGYWQVAEIANIQELLGESGADGPQLSTRERAFNATAKSDLRHVMVEMESYFADHREYPSSLSPLDFSASRGVQVVGRVKGEGYALGAMHQETGHVFCVDTSESGSAAVERDSAATRPEDCLPD